MSDILADRPATRDAALAQLTAPGQFYELEPIVVGGRPIRAFKNAQPSLRHLFDQYRSDRPFLVYGDERYTFEEAWACAARLATLLGRDFGVGKGDRVAISMRNFPEWIIAFTAVTSMGAVAVAMNALWQPEELAFGLEDSGAKVLIADQERLDRLARAEVSPELRVIAVRPKDAAHPAEFHRLLAPLGAVAMPTPDIAPDDPATMFYTSGSTGRPKGVVSSHRNILSALWSWELDGQAGALLMGQTPGAAANPAGLLAVPLFHVTGSHAIYLQSYRMQRKLVCMFKWDPYQAAELIEREKITSFTAPAAMTGDLVRIARETSRDLSSLVTVGGGGAPRAPEQVRQIDATFAKAQPSTGWGMTETNSIGTSIGGPAYLQRPASSGRAAPVLDLAIVDEAGTHLPRGERGELLVRGASVFAGYWNRPEVNAEVFTDGWFHTGDVAYIDDEGFLFIVDRLKDLIIRGGENIGCGAVEAAMTLHPDVFEAAVYGVPDERLGEEVGATIYARPGIDLGELRSFLGGHLARFEVPRYIQLSPGPLPRTASGKILKREIKQAALAAMKAA